MFQFVCANEPDQTRTAVVLPYDWEAAIVVAREQERLKLVPEALDVVVVSDTDDLDVPVSLRGNVGSPSGCKKR